MIFIFVAFMYFVLFARFYEKSQGIYTRVEHRIATVFSCIVFLTGSGYSSTDPQASRRKIGNNCFDIKSFKISNNYSHPLPQIHTQRSCTSHLQGAKDCCTQMILSWPQPQKAGTRNSPILHMKELRPGWSHKTGRHWVSQTPPPLVSSLWVVTSRSFLQYSGNTMIDIVNHSSCPKQELHEVNDSGP